MRRVPRGVYVGCYAILPLMIVGCFVSGVVEDFDHRRIVLSDGHMSTEVPLEMVLDCYVS